MPHNTGSVGTPGVLNRRGVKTLTSAASVEAHDCGTIFRLNSATGFTVTLPTVAQAGAGWWAKFVVTTAPTSGNHVVTEDGATDTNVLVGGINELEVDTNDDGPYTAGATQVNFIANVAAKGDFVLVECDGVNFIISGQTNADGGTTIT